MYKYKNLQAGQLPQGHLSLLQNFLNFIITKYLKQEISSELNVCVDECSPFVFSITGDMKVYHMMTWWKGNDVLPRWRSALSTFIMELLLVPKFDTSSPSVIQDKEICLIITQWNPFNNVYLLSRFDVSSFSVTEDI